MAEGGVGKGHQHAAMAIHHAVGVVLADQESAGVAAIRLDALIERADLAAEAAEPVHPPVAIGDERGVVVEKIVSHGLGSRNYQPSHSSHAPCGWQSARRRTLAHAVMVADSGAARYSPSLIFEGQAPDRAAQAGDGKQIVEGLVASRSLN